MAPGHSSLKKKEKGKELVILYMESHTSGIQNSRRTQKFLVIDTFLNKKKSDSKEDMLRIPFIYLKKRLMVLEVKIVILLCGNGFGTKGHEGTFLE